MKPVDTLHFLVHPGYWMKDVSPGEGISQKEYDKEKELLRVYRDKIDSLKPEDVLVIFTSSEKKELEEKVDELMDAASKKDSKKARQLLSKNRWLALLHYAQKQLGDRCIISSNPRHLPLSTLHDFSGRPTVTEVAQEIREKGYQVDEKTPAEVWGTSLSSTENSCVVRTADVAYHELGLKKYPLIPVQATNLHKMTEKEIERLTEDLRKRNPKAAKSLTK